jgi:hypothetical protein
MSDPEFEKHLDRFLRDRAQADVPVSFEKRMHDMLMKKRSGFRPEAWWASVVAACLLLCLFLLHRPRVVPRTLPIEPASDANGHADRRSGPALQRPLEYMSSAYSPLDVGGALPMTAATRRTAEHNAVCTPNPCFCPEMCGTSN